MNRWLKRAVFAVCMIMGDFAYAEESFHARWTTSFANQYLNKPGISVYKNALMRNEINFKTGEIDFGIWTSLGLGKKDFLKHQPGNEVDLYAGWRHRFDQFETYLRLSYFMNDFPVGGIEKASDDQWIVDAEISLVRVPLLKPYVAYRYFGGVGRESPYPGSFYWLGARRREEFFMFSKTLPINLDLQLAFSDGALGKKGKNGGFIYGRIRISTDIPLTESFSLEPLLVWQIADGSQHGGPRDYAKSQQQLFYGIAFQKSF